MLLSVTVETTDEAASTGTEQLIRSNERLQGIVATGSALVPSLRSPAVTVTVGAAENWTPAALRVKVSVPAAM